METLTAAAEAARTYHALGYNPLPSRTDVKGPACRDYARYRDGERIPEEWLQRWWGENVQLCLGVPWRLVVVDLDGIEAQFCYHRWTRRHGAPRTWTARSGGGGIHLYYSLPPAVVAVPSRKVWGIWDPPTGSLVKHKGIEVLGDKALIIAPPSRHVDTGQPYAFLPGRGPAEMARPAPCPAWVLALRPLKRGVAAAPRRPRLPRALRSPRREEGAVDRDRVLGRLDGDRKLDLAVRAGLRVAGRVNAAGWVSCHSLWRDDAHPSASFCPETGVYWEFGMKSLSFLDVLVELGAFPSWAEACASLELIWPGA